MVEGIKQPFGNTNPYSRSSGAAVKEKMRAGYNPKTQTFELMGAGDSKKIDRMENVEHKVAHLPIPTDYSSPTYLKTVAPGPTAKGTTLRTNTKGVGAYFSGNTSLYTPFINSVTTAQKQI